jgi:hypothetical protein
LEILVRTAVFKSAHALVGWLLQQAADRVDAPYQALKGKVKEDHINEIFDRTVRAVG